MVVYNPHKNTHPFENNCHCNDDNQNIMNNNHCHPDHHDHHCHPEHHDCDPVITISVDDAPEIETDILYGPPGRDGTINGYNKVKITGGHNIELEEIERHGCHHNKEKEIIIHSTTFEQEFESSCNDECNCGCNNISDECLCVEQVKYKSEWDIHHNLNKYPSVTVVDEDNTEIICEVRYISKNDIKLLFNGKFKGKAYLN